MKRITGAALLTVGLIFAMVPLAVAATSSLQDGARVNYSQTAVISAAPASTFQGGSGGDGWAIAPTGTNIYNVYHHASKVEVDCHVRVSGSECVGYPATVTPTNSHTLWTSMMPSMYLDPSTNKLYTYAYDANTSESGVVCANLATPSAPFCGFTPLVAAGSTTRRSGPSEPYISNGVVRGGNFYAFNGQSGAPSGDGDTLMCFNIATEAACPDQPFHFDLGVTSVSTTDNAMAAINIVGGNIFVRLLGTASATGSESLACFNAVAKSQCVGAWPAVIAPSLATKATAIMPLGDGSGALTGVCLPLSDSSISCWGFGGAAVTTPANMASALTFTGPSDYVGQPVLRGTKLFNATSSTSNYSANSIGCYDFDTSASCTNYPYSPTGQSLLYTVNADPTDQNCLWLNADGGASQLQNFNILTRAACGAGQFPSLKKAAAIVFGDACEAGGYTSVEVTSPAASAYSNGVVTILDRNDNSIGTAALIHGSANISNLALETKDFQSFNVNLPGHNSDRMTVVLNWWGNYHSTCVSGGQVAYAIPTTTTTLAPTTTTTEPTTLAHTGADAPREILAGVLAMLTGLVVIRLAARRKI